MNNNKTPREIIWALVVILPILTLIIVGPFFSGPPPPVADLGAEQKKEELDLKKVNEELLKLKQENTALYTSNTKIDRLTKTLIATLAVVGSAFVGLLLFMAGRSLNETQEKKLKQDLSINDEKHFLEKRKMNQEKEFSRENHLQEVFNDLGSEEPRIRIGAVAILVQRIKNLRKELRKARFTTAAQTQPGEDIDDSTQQEIDTIVSVLISVTKHEEKDQIQKYIADGLADALDAIVPYDKTDKNYSNKPIHPISPLKDYDFQGARLENAWWRQIDARGVDFYGAHLARAGLREAFLSGAKLKKANLKGATLEYARMGRDEEISKVDRNQGRTDLQEAQLEGARLKGAVLTDANLKKANLVNADLRGANLTGADLEGADLRGAKLVGVIINGSTNLAGAKINRAGEPSLKEADTTNVIWDDSAPTSGSPPFIVLPL